MTLKKVNILGKKWRVEYRTPAEDKHINDSDADGYCDWTTRTIVIGVEMESQLGDMARYNRKLVRHEVIHAYLFESGLSECSLTVDMWARNEEMVDYFARMGPDIMATWKELGVEED